MTDLPHAAAKTTHAMVVEILQSVPPELEVGTDITLKVKVSCSAACDLRGAPIAVLCDEETLIAAALTGNGAPNETEDLSLKAPAQAGEHVWAVVFRRHEAEHVVHDESCVTVCFKTTPHPISMAVWDVPSPVVVHRPFTVKVGVKCSASCNLTGLVVDICDESGTSMGRGTLDETPWPGTVALYVAEVPLVAPTTVGTSAWTACFAEAPSALAHSEASAEFGFLTAVPPDHQLTVSVANMHTRTPLEGADVRCGSYRAVTDARGLAMLALPAGTYELNAWKVGYDDTPVRVVQLTSDLVIHLETQPTPKRDSDEERVWM
jgi:hypothetical protein